MVLITPTNTPFVEFELYEFPAFLLIIAGTDLAPTPAVPAMDIASPPVPLIVWWDFSVRDRCSHRVLLSAQGKFSPGEKMA